MGTYHGHGPIRERRGVRCTEVLAGCGSMSPMEPPRDRHRLRPGEYDRSEPRCAGERLARGRLHLVRSEKRTGTTTAGREELRTVLDFLRSGDVLMVTRIDRLARSIGDLQDMCRLAEGQAWPAARYRPRSAIAPPRDLAATANSLPFRRWNQSPIALLCL